MALHYSTIMDTRLHLDRSRSGQNKKRKFNGSTFINNANLSSPLSAEDYFHNITTAISPTSGSMIDDYGCTNIQIHDLRGSLNISQNKEIASLPINLMKLAKENLQLPPTLKFKRGNVPHTA